jgi:hypothetical protein
LAVIEIQTPDRLTLVADVLVRGLREDVVSDAGVAAFRRITL